MRDHASLRLSRRGLLRAAGAVGAAAAAGSLAGCDLFAGETGPTEQQQPPAIITLLSSTASLADLYAAAIVAVPALSAVATPIRDDHRAHVKALAQTLGAPTPRPGAATTIPPDRDRAIAALKTAEKAARDDAITECLAAPVRFAPLLGSIAAARATHLEVLI